jgi:hypothetical protein
VRGQASVRFLDRTAQQPSAISWIEPAAEIGPRATDWQALEQALADLAALAFEQD